MLGLTNLNIDYDEEGQHKCYFHDNYITIFILLSVPPQLYLQSKLKIYQAEAAWGNSSNTNILAQMAQ